MYIRAMAIAKAVKKSIVPIKVKDNEQIGIFTEKLMCNTHNIPFNTKRKGLLSLSDDASKKISSDITKCIVNVPIKEHIGGRNGTFDFTLLDGRNLSVKSLYNSSRVCPQEIGQTSANRLKEVLSIEFTDFKHYFIDNIEFMLNQYLLRLFKTGLVSVINYKKGVSYLLDITDSTTVAIARCHESQFQTSKSLENWNESNTVYLVDTKTNKKITIGEVQVHQHRNCCKFRFDIENLLKHNLLENVSVTTIELDHKYKITKEKELKPVTDEIEESIEKLASLALTDQVHS